MPGEPDARWCDPAHGRYEVWEVVRGPTGRRRIRFLHAARTRSEARLCADEIAEAMYLPRSSLVVQDTRRRRRLRRTGR